MDNLLGLGFMIFPVLAIPPLWRVFSRAGLPRPASLLVLFPVFGWTVVGLILALSDWPALRESKP